MYRIVFFGEPGSGKTTLSKRVGEKLGLKVIEASEEVVFPAAKLEELPDERELIAQLVDAPERRSETISREKARSVFSALHEKYGGDIIAKVLHAKHVDVLNPVPCVFSGLRGLENARHCRLHNDLVVYLKTDATVLNERLRTERGLTPEQANAELSDENERYRTREIEVVADLVVDTGTQDTESALQAVLEKIGFWTRMCTRCVNVARNPAITFNEKGLCHICEAYFERFDPEQLKRELGTLERLKRAEGHDVMVGISGGKDSTATLHRIQRMGFRPLAFTFDTGYLPETTVPRARAVARQLGVEYEVIDIRPYLRDADVAAFERLAALYELPFTLETKQAFREAYAEGRKHYSIKCEHAATYVRSCQLCRRLVIRAYHGEATKRGIGAVVLGMNEWTNLSASQGDTLRTASGMRVLQPREDAPSVSVFHLPFLLQRTIKDVERELQELGWNPPEGEELIESNSNSCLLARSTERMAKRMLEFHPDSTRLAREVTVGFIDREQALAALGKLHSYARTPREVLEGAGILKGRE